jgi:hypothetical protein
MTKAALHNGSIGGSYDGTFQQYGVFEESWLVRLASNLSYLEGASLSDCTLRTKGIEARRMGFDSRHRRREPVCYSGLFIRLIKLLKRRQI